MKDLMDDDLSLTWDFDVISFSLFDLFHRKLDLSFQFGQRIV